MPQSENHESSRARAKPQQAPRQRAPSTERSQTTSSPAAGMQEPQQPLEAALGSDFSQATFERHAALLGDSRMSHRMYRQQRAVIVMQLQRDYGNRYVQRLVKHIKQKRAETVQAKLTVGPAGDKYEQEADRVAKQVVGMTEPPAQRQGELEEEEIIQAKPDESAQRQGELGEDELQMQPLVRRRVPLEGGDVEPDVAQTILKAQGSGQPLPEGVRASMEDAFGADFSSVKVHTGAEADALNESVSARAFTTGQDVFFRKGDYNPGSASGQEIIAHELTHVVQQNGDQVQQSQQSAQASYPLTTEASIGPWQPNRPAYANRRPIRQVVQRHWDKTETALTSNEITERKKVGGVWNTQYTGAAKADLNTELQAGLTSAQDHPDAAEDGMPWLKKRRKTKKGTTPVYLAKHITLAKKQWGAAHKNLGGLLPGVTGAGGYMEYYAEPSPDAATYWETNQKQPLGKNRILKQTNVVGTTYWWASADHYNTVTFINNA